MLEKSQKKLRNKKGLLTVFMVILLIGAMVAFNTTATAAEQKVITLKYSSGMMPQDPTNMMTIRTLDLIEKKTNGRVKIERFMGGALGAPFEQFGLVKSGAVDIIALWVDQFPQELPLHQITTSLQMVGPEQALANVTALTREIPETKALLEAEQKQNNIVILYWNDFGRSGITTRFPAKSMADLKGKKLNVVSSYQRDVHKDMGWVPVNVIVPELYEAMSRGVIDAIIMSTTAVLPLKWYEIAKAHLILGPANTVMSQPLTVNRDVWNRLPKDIQQAFIEASLDTAKWSIWLEKDLAKKTYEAFENVGASVVQVPEKEAQAFFDIDYKHALNVYMENAKKMGVKDQMDVIVKYWNDMRVGKWKK